MIGAVWQSPVAKGLDTGALPGHEVRSRNNDGGSNANPMLATTGTRTAMVVSAVASHAHPKPMSVQGVFCPHRCSPHLRTPDRPSFVSALLYPSER